MNLNAILSISGEPIPTGGGASSWDDISDKPFSTVDTEGGLTIQDDTLMIDTLDHIATIDYVDQQIESAQSDWDETDSSQLDYIKNKPPVKAGTGEGSVVFGDSGTASGQYAVTMGSCVAAGQSAHAEGIGTQALAQGTHTEGAHTVAAAGVVGKPQHVQGRWNIPDENQLYADIVGNGSLNNRSNAEATDWDGNKYLAGDVYVNVTDWSDPKNNSTKLTPGGSAQIDNKSLVKVNDVIQEAVPVYSEQVTTTHTGAKFTHFEYPAGNDLDTFFEYLPTLNQSQDYYNVYLSVNGVMYQGTWTAADNYGGWTLQMDIGSGVQGYEMYMAMDTSGVEPMGKIHIYLNGMLISGSGSTGNVDWLLIEPSEEDASFEQWARNVSRWGTVSNTETVYHKLPHEYYDGVQEVTSYLSNYGTVQNGKAVTVTWGDGIVITHYTVEDFNGLAINVNADKKSVVTMTDGVVKSLRGDAFTADNFNTTVSFNCWYDDSCDLFDSENFSSFLWDGYSFIVPVKGTYILINYNNGHWSAKGYESLFDSVEIIPHADPETEYNGKYYSEGTPVVQFVHPKFSAQQGDSFSNDAYGINYDFDYAKLNAQFIPIDNSTLRINSDGNIYSAIPAPPTNVDDDYTLHAVVTNGEVHYYWLGTPQ